ncbi:hypothetical protein CEXT_355141 [Caerostris extrusa]|uniref:Uncharacterized protein n=1 Tax=Caerostris extrusa TaxID=172846 RepID=A0AAV4MG02_CAEEX|nr:hypothetical protein CEXT_355141 [Caerostris extrusa]
MISHLGKDGKQRTLGISSSSLGIWDGSHEVEKKKQLLFLLRKLKKKLAHQRAIGILISLANACKSMEKITSRRLNFYLTTNNLLQKEQYAFRQEHCITD